MGRRKSSVRSKSCHATTEVTLFFGLDSLTKICRFIQYAQMRWASHMVATHLYENDSSILNLSMHFAMSPVNDATSDGTFPMRSCKERSKESMSRDCKSDGGKGRLLHILKLKQWLTGPSSPKKKEGESGGRILNIFSGITPAELWYTSFDTRIYCLAESPKMKKTKKREALGTVLPINY